MKTVLTDHLKLLTGAISYLQQTMLIVLLELSQDEYKTNRFHGEDENRKTFH